ncbi:hypothetical protein [Kordia sp. SMS9]|uniref:hypothetical protein n=1 Tax=Kordia sp. SMS9 TaxID=2282170 RepID=UPI000E0D446E|nr:hypothetical protein [Kordia sp. SMS9]
MKSKTSDLLIQIISVTIGVFLGFAISNWSESRKESQKYNALIQNIASEIQSNQQKINNVLEYHKMVRDSTRYYLNQKENLQGKSTFFKGINTLSFSNSAYQTGIQTGLFNTMELEKIQAINDIYTKQRSYEDFSNIMLSGLISMDFDESDASARKIAMFLTISMSDIVIKEQQLLNSIQKALSLIK